MNNKQKNVLVVIAILAVIFLIVFNYSKKDIQPSVPDKKITPSFLTQKEPQTVVMQALLTGELKLEGKCLKVNNNVIVWPYGFSLKTQGDTVNILNEKGEVIATVGDLVKLGGGQVESSEFKQQEPSSEQQDCKGPFWIVGEIMPTMN